jgi:hypothetical protein
MSWLSRDSVFSFDLTSIETHAPTKSGIFGCLTETEWVYIGHAEDIRAALLTHAKAGFDTHNPPLFTWELWPREVRRAKAWNRIVEHQPACNAELKHFSDELYHFVGSGHPKTRDANYKILQSVLRQRQIRRMSWLGDPNVVGIIFDPAKSLKVGELMLSNTICFCDMRPSELKIHIAKYGEFGLGFHRGFLMRLGCRPMMYVPHLLDDFLSIHGATLTRNILKRYTAARTALKKELANRSSPDLVSCADETIEAFDALLDVFQRDFMPFFKTYDAHLSEDDTQNFFMEREWRRFCALNFEPEQVASILVAPGFADRVKTDFPEYANSRIDEIAS